MEGFKDPEDALFPLYHGETKTIHITSAYMLSVNFNIFRNNSKYFLYVLHKSLSKLL